MTYSKLLAIVGCIGLLTGGCGEKEPMPVDPPDADSDTDTDSDSDSDSDTDTDSDSDSDSDSDADTGLSTFDSRCCDMDTKFKGCCPTDGDAGVVYYSTDLAVCEKEFDFFSCEVTHSVEYPFASDCGCGCITVDVYCE